MRFTFGSESRYSTKGKQISKNGLKGTFYSNLRYTQFHPHPNIVGLVDAFTSSEDMEEALVSDGSFDLYFVTPLMFADLSVTIQTQTLNHEQVQFITYQLLRALKYIHSAGIHHR